MVVAVLSIDASPLSALARRLAAVDADRRAPLEAIGGAWESSTKARFQTGRAPDGTPWRPSLRAKQGGKTLVLSTRLRESIVHKVDGDTVEVGTNVAYAAAHQFGATIRPKKSGGLLRFRLPNGAFVSAKQVTLPARPFIGIEANDYLTFTEILEGFVEARTGGGPGAAPGGAA